MDRHIISPEEIAEMAAEARQNQWIRPPTNIVQDYVAHTQNPENGFMFGIDRIDWMIRGIRPGELCIVSGRAHSSKTQLLLNAVVNNPKRNIIWFTPDEVGELVMIKLATIVNRLDPIKLEEDVKRDDPEAIQTLREFASTSLPNFLVVDRTADVEQMRVALSEAEDHWGGAAGLVVYDFLELLPGEGDARGVQKKADQLKQFGSDHRVPMAVVHQTGRSGERGVPMGLDSMKYGGEQQATFVLEVFRKRDNQGLNEAERANHVNTATVNVAKNKRPPCQTGEVDVFLDPDFGTMRVMVNGDPGTPLSHLKFAHGGPAPDTIRTMTREESDRYREHMGYARLYDGGGSSGLTIEERLEKW